MHVRSMHYEFRGFSVRFLCRKYTGMAGSVLALNVWLCEVHQQSTWSLATNTELQLDGGSIVSASDGISSARRFHTLLLSSGFLRLQRARGSAVSCLSSPRKSVPPNLCVLNIQVLRHTPSLHLSWTHFPN